MAISNAEKQRPDGASGHCCAGKTKWVWIALVAALSVIMLGKFAKQQSACCGGMCQVPAHLSESNTTTSASAAPISSVVTAPTAKNLPRLVDLGAGKCIPCKLMAPILEEMKKTYAGKLEVQFIDVWLNPDEGAKYGIKIIPTQIFYNAAGQELFRHEGFISKEDLLAKWQEFGVDLTVAAVSPAADR